MTDLTREQRERAAHALEHFNERANYYFWLAKDGGNIDCFEQWARWQVMADKICQKFDLWPDGTLK
jgi:hypothetical protein